MVELILRALTLAKKGFPEALPNPLVGCVIAKNGHVIAEGYHKKFGRPHAEIEALRKAGSQAEGATLFVNLEPCCNWGKTPPCCKAIVKAGIARVVASMTDPNPEVNGKGFRYLKHHGIKVEIKPDREAQALNLPFVTQVTKKRPYIVLKAAMTLDGKITDFKGHSKWITDSASRKLARKLRSCFDAILVGANTVIADNPELTPPPLLKPSAEGGCRKLRFRKAPLALSHKSGGGVTSHGYGRNPTRIILDPHQRIPKNARVLTDAKAPTIIVRTEKLEVRRLKTEKNIEFLKVPQKKGSLDLSSLLKLLSQKAIQTLLVEGGGTTHAHFTEAGLFDELFYFVAPKILGGTKSKTSVEGKGLPLAKARELAKIYTTVQDRTLIIRGTTNKKGLFWSLLNV